MIVLKTLISVVKQKTTVEEQVRLGLHQINLLFCVLGRSPLGGERNMSTQKKKTIMGGFKSEVPANPSLCTCTCKEPFGRTKGLCLGFNSFHFFLLYRPEVLIAIN